MIRHDRVAGVMVSAEDYEAMRAYYADCLLKTMLETALAAEKAGPTPGKRKQLLAEAAQIQKARPNPFGTPSLQCCFADVGVIAGVWSGLYQRAVRQKSQAKPIIFPISNDSLSCVDISIIVPVRGICIA